MNKAEAQRIIWAAVKTLPWRQGFIIRSRHDGYTLAEIAKALGFTRERVRSEESIGMRRLRRLALLGDALKKLVGRS